MQTYHSDAYPNDAFLGASAARISAKLASLRDFLRMRAGYVDGSAAPLSPNETARRDDLGPAKDIMLAVAVSATIWGAVVLMVLDAAGVIS
jgi:hypothetical protein